MSANPFDGIREFVSAAQSLSFTAAALELGVTSSAVGKSVTRLEARLGVKLLHRTTRRLVLTAEGEPLKRYPYQIQQRFDAGAIYLLQNAMQRTMREGTGRSVYSQLPSSLALAGSAVITVEAMASAAAVFACLKIPPR